MLPESLNEYESLFSEYTELRAQENRNVVITVLNGDITANSKTSNSGMSARVCDKGLWGFASAPDWGPDAVRQVVTSASRNAKFMVRSAQPGKNEFDLTSDRKNLDLATKHDRRSQKDLIDFVRMLDSYIEKHYPDLQSRLVMLKNLDMEKRLMTSYGSENYSLTPRSNLIVMMTCDSRDGPCELYDAYGGLGQFEDNFPTPDQMYKEIEKLYERLMQKREGVYADAGRKTVVLDSDLAGILAHEAIGHTTEADLVLGGSVAQEMLNRPVASPLVSLVDFANTYNNQMLPVPIYMDDEGTPAQDTVIIEQGILKTYMHNKESAHRFEQPGTGHARAYEFSDEPLIRMRNTAFLPGESSLEEMIASVDDGYYLVQRSNGQADSTSEFMFGVPMGYEIKNGKIGKAIKDTTISGVAFDVLKTVDMISDEMTWSSTGMCGKKQMIPVGMGGPAIKCQLNIGGR